MWSWKQLAVWLGGGMEEGGGAVHLENQIKEDLPVLMVEEL